MSHVITKYSRVSRGTYMKSKRRSAHARDTRNVAVLDLNLPPRAHVAMTTELPIIPMKKVMACVTTIVRNA